MNLCFFSGEIISDIKFEFVYNSKKHVSYLEFEIEIDDHNELEKSVIKVYAFDNIADFVYQNYAKGHLIIGIGRVENSMVKLVSVHNFFKRL